MAIGNEQIGWSVEAKLLRQISKQLDQLIKLQKQIITTTTTTTV